MDDLFYFLHLHTDFPIFLDIENSLLMILVFWEWENKLIVLPRSPQKLVEERTYEGVTE